MVSGGCSMLGGRDYFLVLVVSRVGQELSRLGQKSGGGSNSWLSTLLKSLFCGGRYFSKLLFKASKIAWYCPLVHSWGFHQWTVHEPFKNNMWNDTILRHTTVAPIICVWPYESHQSPIKCWKDWWWDAPLYLLASHLGKLGNIGKLYKYIATIMGFLKYKWNFTFLIVEFAWNPMCWW